MAREKKDLYLLPEQWQRLEEFRSLLGHEDFEESIAVLIDLGLKAMSVTDRDNRVVRLLGGPKLAMGEQCKHCAYQRTGYKYEAAVRMGVDLPPNKPLNDD